MKTLSDKNNNTLDIIYYPNLSTSELIRCNMRESFSYDTTSNRTTATDYVEGSTNQVTTYTYEKRGNLSWITSVSGNCCGFNVSYEYDDQGNLLKETDANGNIYTYTYVRMGICLQLPTH